MKIKIFGCLVYNKQSWLPDHIKVFLFLKDFRLKQYLSCDKQSGDKRLFLK